jgi:hypothetical protein
MTKALSLHGLGLYIYSGEDIPEEASNPKHKPTDGSLVSEKQMTVLRDVAMEIIAHMTNDDLVGAYEEYMQVTDAEEKTYLWSLLDSKVRSTLKKHGESLKGN